MDSREGVDVEEVVNGPRPDPDDPVLARAQVALKAQLSDSHDRLAGELREKEKQLSDEATRREGLGVDLYNKQQQLARLQADLERALGDRDAIAARRGESESRVRTLREEHERETRAVEAEKQRTDKAMEDLDKQAATLKQIEGYSAQMASDIAVTRRATYKAEQTMQQLEKEKNEQDLQIDKLQEQIKSVQSNVSLRRAQVVAQKKQTGGALATLKEAEVEMESVHKEKQQLVAQWNACLMTISKREAALNTVKDAVKEQREQEASIRNEIGRFKKDIHAEKVKQEALQASAERLTADVAHVERAIEGTKERCAMAHATFAKLERSQGSVMEKMKRVELERRAVATEVAATDAAFMRAVRANSDLEDHVAEVLGSQLTAEKGVGGTGKEIALLRKQVREREQRVIAIQNEVAKLQVDTLNTGAHNSTLETTLEALEEDYRAKAAIVDGYVADMARRHDEIEKKTHAVDILNREYEKLVAAMENGPETGPLEATIANLGRELEKKDKEGREVQRRWVGVQAELVAKQQENVALGEELGRKVANVGVLEARKARLEGELEAEKKEMKEAERKLSQLDKELSRMNALISKNTALCQSHTEEKFSLERAVAAELADLEAASERVQGDISCGRTTKAQLVESMLEMERRIMLWERKIQLQQEMDEVLDPSAGQDLIGAMTKEIHRMELRKSELERNKEALIKELERGIEKRATISLKGRAAVATAKKHANKMTEKQLAQKRADMERAIQKLEDDCAEADNKMAQLDSERLQLAEQLQEVTTECGEARVKADTIKAETSSIVSASVREGIKTECWQTGVRLCERIGRGDVLDLNLGARLPQASQIEDLTAAATELKHSLESTGEETADLRHAVAKLEVVAELCELMRTESVQA